MGLVRHARLVTALAALIVLGSTPGAPLRSGPLVPAEAQPAPDTRDRLPLTPSERDVILAEMRTMLQSLSDILQGLVAGDLVKAEQAARAAAAPMAAEQGLEKKLPAHFVQLDARIHKRFASLADAIKKGGARDAALRGLAAVTAYCVTCHATYRIEETR